MQIVLNSRPANYRRFPVVSETSTKSRYKQGLQIISIIFILTCESGKARLVLFPRWPRSKHGSFVSIVNIGELAIPLILDELRVEPSLLFLALRRITGEDPVSPSDRGNIKSMVDAWLAWGKRNGF